MIIIFHIPDKGKICFEISHTEYCTCIEDFKTKYANANFYMIGDEEPFNIEYYLLDKQAVLKELATHLWTKFGDVPTDDDGADGTIDESFLHFPKGTDVYEIWTWFEFIFDVSVAKDLMGLSA